MKRFIIYIDGSSRGNPGPAGVGYVIENAEGEEIFSFSTGIGEATNNVAEYTALIKGLEKLKELGADEVHIKTDSELLYKQITGGYRVRDRKLLELYMKAVKVIGEFPKVKIEKIPRKENKADKLARRRKA